MPNHENGHINLINRFHIIVNRGGKRLKIQFKTSKHGKQSGNSRFNCQKNYSLLIL